jgi:hypothetical protein
VSAQAEKTGIVPALMHFLYRLLRSLSLVCERCLFFSNTVTAKTLGLLQQSIYSNLELLLYFQVPSAQIKKIFRAIFAVLLETG